MEILIVGLVFLISGTLGLNLVGFLVQLNFDCLYNRNEVLLIRTLGSVIVERYPINIQSIDYPWLDDGFVFRFLLLLHYKNE